MNTGIVALGLAVLLTLATTAPCVAEEPGTADRWIHPKCKPLDIAKNGPFIQSDDGTLTVVAGNVLETSTDGGKTWTKASEVIVPGMKLDHVGHVGQPLRTDKGALVILYLDMGNYIWAWDNAKGEPKPECKLELWAIRSTDGGKTWTDKQRLLDGYNADFMGFIQTKQGWLVATMEHLVPALRRWVCCSFVSKDDGKTWKQSNLIDLGGHGHHDGAVEPTVVELKDGRLMMLIRTSLDQFWKAYSDDGGQYWRTIMPSGLDASSAPGWVLRLKSGRLAFVWNRVKAEGAKEAPKGNSGGPAFEFPASWYREELSIAFSQDEGQTWTKPVVIARQPRGQLAYPYMLERTPGELWVFTRYTYLQGGKPAKPLAVSLKEADFLQKE
ncbi:MAG: exo-alpha-sialidase [Phycisphaerae bacterium]|nr:exo-alpha-sialidase [Phycisphaerae bacterium]